jgi:hypothetical protein
MVYAPEPDAFGGTKAEISPSLPTTSPLAFGCFASDPSTTGSPPPSVRTIAPPIDQSIRSVRSVNVVHIPKNHLMLIAGLVWCAAGAMVCTIGLPMEFVLAPSHLILFPLAVVIFLVFYVFVFSRLVRKHAGRIRARTEDRLPFWHFFNASSWAVMAVMMGGGLALRLSHLIPDWMIAFFYSGLGVALFLCGIRFLGIFARKDVLTLTPE